VFLCLVLIEILRDASMATSDHGISSGVDAEKDFEIDDILKHLDL
jgi:hypothetical protein